MTSFQRVVKYCGIALAICLTIGIITAICAAVFGVNIHKGTEKNIETVVEKIHLKYSEKSETSGSIVSNVYEYKDFSSMDIEIDTSTIYIETGDEYKIETKNVPDTLEIAVKDSTLVIENKGDSFDWLNDKTGNKNPKIYITVPEGYSGEKIKITQGTGTVSISDIELKEFTMEGGCGNLEGDHLQIEDVRIHAGVGEVVLNDVELGKVSLNGGVGSITIDGKIIDRAEIDGGVGDIDIELSGKREDFNIDVEGALGDIRINNQKVKDIKDNSNDKPSLEIDGGIGSISVNFKND